MSFINKGNIKSSKERGFTIVELLIVIVVIGILAAITIVSFNGVTARANASSAKSAATTAVKKAEAYNAELNNYPTTPANLTGAASTTTYQLTGVSFNTTARGGTTPNWTAPTGAPSTPSTINFFNCSTGQRFDYWDYASTAANKWTAMYTGGATAANCPENTYVSA